ncbi:hypothetical protein C8R44DRAFT_550783, partial [Mycena epipterygia]
TAHGHAGLTPLWVAMELERMDDDESAWVEGIRQMCKRLNNLIVVASLLLTSSAAFITTIPPKAAMVDYTLRGPYICILSSFGLFIGGIISAGGTYLMLTRARPHWVETVLYASRPHVYSTLIVLSYPFFSIGLVNMLLSFGM